MSIKSNFTSKFLGGLRESGLLDEEQLASIEKKVKELFDYQPKIGLLGCTGVGKSSLCNALFGSEVATVSAVVPGTREEQEITIPMGAKGISLVDVPGVGEDSKRDVEYANLYQNLIPKLDLVVWLIQVDSRRYETDLRFYEDVVKSKLGNTPFLIVLSQAEKAEPIREYFANNPKALSERQKSYIEQRVEYVAHKFGVSETNVIAVSAHESINLSELLLKMVEVLPPTKAIATANKTVTSVSRPIENPLWRIFLKAADLILTEIPVIKTIYSAIKKIWKSIFG